MLSCSTQTRPSMIWTGPSHEKGCKRVNSVGFPGMQIPKHLSSGKNTISTARNAQQCLHFLRKNLGKKLILITIDRILAYCITHRLFS